MGLDIGYDLESKFYGSNTVKNIFVAIHESRFAVIRVLILQIGIFASKAAESIFCFTENRGE